MSSSSISSGTLNTEETNQNIDVPTQNESTSKKMNPIDITKLKLDEDRSMLNTTREPELTARALFNQIEIDNSTN